MDNLQKSEVVISRILTLLLDWGIQESQLEFSELALPANEFGSYFFPCLDWLEREGIIRVGKTMRTLDSNCSGMAMNPVLTAYGFQMLGQSVQVGNDQIRLVEQVQKVSKSGPNYSGIGDFVGGFLGGFTKSLGS